MLRRPRYGSTRCRNNSQGVSNRRSSVAYVADIMTSISGAEKCLHAGRYFNENRFTVILSPATCWWTSGNAVSERSSFYCVVAVVDGDGDRSSVPKALSSWKVNVTKHTWIRLNHSNMPFDFPLHSVTLINRTVTSSRITIYTRLIPIAVQTIAL